MTVKPISIYLCPPPFGQRIQLWHRDRWEFGEVYQLDEYAPVMCRLDSYLDAEPFDTLDIIFWLPAPDDAPVRTSDYNHASGEIHYKNWID